MDGDGTRQTGSDEAEFVRFAVRAVVAVIVLLLIAGATLGWALGQLYIGLLEWTQGL